MKNFKIKYVLGFIFLALLFTSVSSCTNDDSDPSPTGLPKINSVSESNPEITELVPTQIGTPKNVYAIQGSGFISLQKIYFNGLDTYFNPTLVTDNTIFVTIDETTPYSNQANELKIVTSLGSAVFSFVIAPPPPSITTFNPINGNVGDVITVTGKYFLNPIVKFGTISGEIISSTLTEIKVKIPAGADDKYLSVTNISGTATAPESIGSAAYDDAFYLFDYVGSWGNYPLDIANTLDKSQGLKSIRAEFPGWSGTDLKFKTRKDLTSYKSFRISLKGVKAGSLKLVFNGDNGGWSYQIIMPLTTEWTTVEVPFSDIGNPTFLDKLTFQESGNFGGNTIFIDDMGFVLK
jgi:hypothetical protein